ncbi:MAG: hypothetical protein E3J66_07535 [Dehalococcoidia bacterium]|nr:MAG: hypothetical protein E3J66_07535 [Dehalococcoidia bacterium]
MSIYLGIRALMTVGFVLHYAKKEKRSFIKRNEVNLWHKLADAGMHSKPFPKRSLIGSANSLMKRGYGSWVSSRVWHGQSGELVVKSLVLNPKQSLRKMIHSIIRLTMVSPCGRISTKLTVP